MRRNTLSLFGSAVCALLMVAGCDGSSPGAPGPVGPAGPAGAMGPAGPIGAQGADGSLRVYGDGSAGNLVVSASSTLEVLTTNGNTQFDDITVVAGQTLTVPSGTVLRCTGTANIAGRILVSVGARPNNRASGGSAFSMTSGEAGVTGSGGAAPRVLGHRFGCLRRRQPHGGAHAR
jgi:hypothetical protein